MCLSDKIVIALTIFAITLLTVRIAASLLWGI